VAVQLLASTNPARQHAVPSLPTSVRARGSRLCLQRLREDRVAMV